MIKKQKQVLNEKQTQAPAGIEKHYYCEKNARNWQQAYQI